METTLNYQFNYPPRSPRSAPAIDPNAPLFASEDGLVASLSSQECIFQVKRSGDTHVMTFQVLQALDQCREFRSLDEHSARIETTIAGLAGKREDIKRVLESLIQRELLVSDDDFIARFARAAARDSADLRGVFIRACDRPEQLSRLLASLTDYERRHRAGRRYIVLDDSSLPAHANDQRDALREFARTTGCKVHYVGRAESEKLAERFGKELRNPDVAVVGRAYVSQRVLIGGEVDKPGIQDLPGRIGVLEGIMLAGGFRDTAELSQVALIRLSPACTMGESQHPAVLSQPPFVVLPV